MEGHHIGLIVCRVLLLIFGAIVLGLAASIANDFNDAQAACDLYTDASGCHSVLNYIFHSPQPSIQYAAFTGAWGILAALVTLAAVFVSAIPWIVSLGFDGLAAIFYFAGGINDAVQRSHDVLFDRAYYDQFGDQGDALYTRWSTRWDTVTAFQFLAFIVSVVAMVLVFLSRRSGGVRHSAV